MLLLNWSLIYEVMIFVLLLVLSTNILEGFGNATRIDYGTGHEAKFMGFLFCLMKIGVLSKEDAAAVVLKIVNRYFCQYDFLCDAYTN